MAIFIHGLGGAMARLENLRGALPGLVARAVAQSAPRAEQTAKELCPVESGELKGSITAGVAHLPAGAALTLACATDYAAYVERGTARSPARPFLYPAAKICADETRRRIAAAIKEVL